MREVIENPSLSLENLRCQNRGFKPIAWIINVCAIVYIVTLIVC